MSLPPIEWRISQLLSLIAESRRPCKACGAELYFVRHRNGNLAPYTADGVNHFATCKEAERFRRKDGTV